MKQASVGEGPGPRSGMHVRSVEIHVLRYAMSGARRPTQAYATRGRRSACFPLIAAKLFSNRSTGRGRTSVNVAPQSACGAWSMPTHARPRTHAGTGDGVSGVTASSLCMLAVSKQMQPTDALATTFSPQCPASAALVCMRTWWSKRVGSGLRAPWEDAGHPRARRLTRSTAPQHARTRATHLRLGG